MCLGYNIPVCATAGSFSGAKQKEVCIVTGKEGGDEQRNMEDLQVASD